MTKISISFALAAEKELSEIESKNLNPILPYLNYLLCTEHCSTNCVTKLTKTTKPAYLLCRNIALYPDNASHATPSYSNINRESFLKAGISNIINEQNIKISNTLIKDLYTLLLFKLICLSTDSLVEVTETLLRVVFPS